MHKSNKSEAMDDSTGKYKNSDARGRSAVLSTALVIGLCLGVVAAQKMYLYNQESSAPALMFHSRKLRFSTVFGKPRSDLEQLLQRIAPQKEVLIAISNSNLLAGELQMWIDCVKRLHFQNWLIVALDDNLRQYCHDHNLNCYYRPVVIPKSQQDTGANHATSAMKFQIIREFLQLGWSVFLSDVDVVVLQNPFDHLHRDSDVEGMSDGFDDTTAYGAIYGLDDPSMGWSRYAQGVQHLAFNSGLFYLRANERTINLMKRIDDRLMKAKLWDQSVYNEELFFISHGRYKSPQVTVRALDIMAFMNSKVLFKKVRHMPRNLQPKPVMVHMNYHPNKGQRMRAAMKYYIEGDATALDGFPGGSEPGT